MVPSWKSRFQSTQGSNLVKAFWYEKCKMSNVMLDISDVFVFGMSSNVLAFKVSVFASDFEF